MSHPVSDNNEQITYLMEHSGEGERLKQKTRPERVLSQAKWAGLRPGMRLLDVGCGSGAATAVLGGYCGNAMGIDISRERIEMAQREYPEYSFLPFNINDELYTLGSFDFIWVRFFLEYHRSGFAEIISRLRGILNPGGILCCIDLDYNCLNHYPAPRKFERELENCIRFLEEKMNWDPFVGRKLYTSFYDCGYENIDVSIDAHHCIFGTLSEVDSMNWFRKIEIAIKKSAYTFPEYDGDYHKFRDDAEAFFTSPRRFTYTPLIMVRGINPS